MNLDCQPCGCPFDAHEPFCDVGRLEFEKRVSTCGVCSQPWPEHRGEEYARHYLLDNPTEPCVVLLREDMEEILHVIATYRLPTITSSANITHKEVRNGEVHPRQQPAEALREMHGRDKAPG